MSISIKKLGILAVMATLLVVLAALRPTAPTPVAQADLGSPGGIAALPSAAPAVPGLANQGLPAIIGTGQMAIVAVFCTNSGVEAVQGLPFEAGPCFDPVTIQLKQVYPTSGAVPMATLSASGGDTLVVTDNSGADMDSAVGVIAVGVQAAAATQGNTKGVNEIVKVTATDSAGGGGCTTCGGDQRSINIVIVDTMLAWGPAGQISTASQDQPVYVSYHCDVLGRDLLTPGTSQFLAEADAGNDDQSQGLNDMYDGLYGPNAFGGGPGAGWGSNTLLGRDLLNGGSAPVAIPDVWCGGNTPALFDDFVDFQTDKGIFSVDPAAVLVQQNAANLGNFLNWFYPPIIDAACGEGQEIDTFDIDALLVWEEVFASNNPVGLGVQGGCDVDGWRNGVVTTQLLGNGNVGVATISAQQGGGVAKARTINVTFEGAAALSLFITAPKIIGTTGDSFTVAVVDQDGRPVGNEAVTCTVDPTGGALAILNQTATTGGATIVDSTGNVIPNPAFGEATFKLIPTGKSVVAAEELTITCTLDRDRSVSASDKVTLSQTPNLESVALVEGCNPLAATWPDATAIATVSGAVAPAEALEAIWKFDPATGMWQGFSPTAPAGVSDLATIDRLDAIFVCVNAAATIGRPVI